MSIDQVRHLLRCPICASPFDESLGPDGAASPGGSGVLRCSAGHTFDISRHGYVNLLTGRSPAGADTPAMVTARADLLAAGLLDPVAKAVIDLVPPGARVVLDAGAGTGHYLAAVLDARPDALGIAVDISKAAARHGARAHPRLASVVADVWHGLPVVDAGADVVLDIFAPRNAAQFHRVLRPTGRLVVVTPTPEHLGELVGPLGLLTVDPAKERRLGASLDRWFELGERQQHAYRLSLRRDEAARFVAMGPSAWHVDQDRLAQRLATVPEPVVATVSVALSVYRPRRLSEDHGLPEEQLR